MSELSDSDITTDAPTTASVTQGQLIDAISTAMMKLYREYLGRGPTNVRTSLRDNVLVVLMEDIFTRAEQSLIADRKADEVLATRGSFQDTMRRDIVATVEELTGRHVVAFMSTNHVDPDLACEILVLGPAPG